MAVTISPLVNTDTFGDWKDKTNDLIDMAAKTLTIGDGETNSGNVEISGNVTVEQTLLVDTIQPYTAGPNKIAISGNVGIGITSPSSDLHVKGDDVGGSAGNQSLVGTFEADAGNDNLLQISATREADGLYWRNAGFRLQQKVDTSYMGYIQFNGANNDRGISFGTGQSDSATGVSERLRINSSGDVGIGTTSPSATLDVNGTVKATTFSGSGSGLTNLSGTHNHDDRYYTESEIDAKLVALDTATFPNNIFIGDKIIHLDDPDTSIRFPIINTFTVETAAAERMRVASDGNVGIGTSNPLSKLDVVGSARLIASSSESCSIEVGAGRQGNGNSYIDLVGAPDYPDYGTRLIRFAGPDANFRVEHRGTGLLEIWSREAGSVRIGTSNQERIRVAPGGNVGIGTTSPSATLDVNGTVKATAFSGNGSGLTTLNATNISTGTLNNNRLSSNVVYSVNVVTNPASPPVNGTFVDVNVSASISNHVLTINVTKIYDIDTGG